MPWYYANHQHRLGPVSDTEFARLAKDKVIVDDTLVWRHGMADWKTYAEVVATLPPPEITAIPPGMESKVPQTSDAVVQEILAATPPRLAYAGFWIRVCAKFIDLMVLNVLVMLLAKAFGVWHEPPPVENMEQFMEFMREMNSLGRIVLVTSLAYQWFFLRRFSATPGKLLLGLKVVRSDGSPLGHGRIFGRFFAEMLNQFTLLIGYLVVAFDDEKRAMHDVICDTRVVYRQRRD